MSAPPPTAVTERLIIPVKGGIDAWKEPLKALLLTLKKQPGYMRTRWGPWNEDMDKLDLMIGWASPEANTAFMASSDFATAISAMKPVQAGEPQSYHVKFVPFAPKEAINSPIAELITIPNCTASEDELRASFEKVKALPGCNGEACGYSTTEVKGQGKVFVAAVGWQSLEASQAADKSAYIPAGAGEAEIHHVNFNFPIKGFSVTN